MTEHTRALASAIIDALPEAMTVDDVLSELDAVIQAHISSTTRPVAPAPVENTIDNVMGWDTDQITLSPYGEKWVLYIPPTREEHVDARKAQTKEPWGETTWDTLQGAVASLSLAVKAGHVVYNDGRIAK